MTILKGKKLVENTKTENFKYDILGSFQTMCHLVNIFSPFISISILALVIGSMVETNHDRRWIDQARVLDDWSSDARLYYEAIRLFPLADDD